MRDYFSVKKKQYTNKTNCADCSGAATICPCPLQVVTEPTDTRFRAKKSILIYTTNFDIVPIFNFSVTRLINLLQHYFERRLLHMTQTSVYLCDALQCNIINVIFAKDCNYFNLYSPDGKCYQNLRLVCRVIGKHAST